MEELMRLRPMGWLSGDDYGWAQVSYSSHPSQNPHWEISMPKNLWSDLIYLLFPCWRCQTDLWMDSWRTEIRIITTMSWQQQYWDRISFLSNKTLRMKHFVYLDKMKSRIRRPSLSHSLPPLVVSLWNLFRNKGVLSFLSLRVCG